MTATFGTDKNNDLYLGNDKNLVLLTGLPAIIAACETATKAQLAEMVLSIEQGIPNFETIWIGSPNYATYVSYLRNTLVGILGVQAVSSLQLKVLNNMLSYTAEIKTEFGTAVING